MSDEQQDALNDELEKLTNASRELTNKVSVLGGMYADGEIDEPLLMNAMQEHNRAQLALLAFARNNRTVKESAP